MPKHVTVTLKPVLLFDAKSSRYPSLNTLHLILFYEYILCAFAHPVDGYRQRHAVVVTCRCCKLCKMEYFLSELLKGLWNVFSGWKWLITEIINLVPAILFRQLAFDNISHHSAELTWWQWVSTLYCIQDSLPSRDITWSDWGWWFPSVLLLHMLGYYQACCKP